MAEAAKILRAHVAQLGGESCLLFVCHDWREYGIERTTEQKTFHAKALVAQRKTVCFSLRLCVRQKEREAFMLPFNKTSI
jgi:hypothetical protein